MTRNLLIRGMVAGILAAILATLFARALAEPQVDLAIAYEASHSAHEAHSMPGMPSAKEPELVSRGTQKGLGLLTALTACCSRRSTTSASRWTFRACRSPATRRHSVAARN